MTTKSAKVRDWLNDLTDFLTELAGLASEIGIKAEGLGQGLPAIREALDSPAADEPGALYVVFDGPPSHESGRFVEVETPDGRSVGPKQTGADWKQRPDGLWNLGPFYTTPPQPAPNAEGFAALVNDARAEMEHYWLGQSSKHQLTAAIERAFSAASARGAVGDAKLYEELQHYKWGFQRMRRIVDSLVNDTENAVSTVKDHVDLLHAAPIPKREGGT